MGTVVLAGAALVLEETKGRRRRFDLPGAALAAVGLFSLLVALSRGNAWGWTAPPTEHVDGDSAPARALQRALTRLPH